MRRILIFCLSFFLLFSLVAWSSRASAKTTSSGSIQLTFDDPLFPDSIIWYPGLTVNRSITVTNSSGRLQEFSLQAVNFSQTGSLAKQMQIRVKQGEVSLYPASGDKTLESFWNNGQVSLSGIEGGKTVTYEIFVTMLSSADNAFQNKQVKFDLMMGFVGTASRIRVAGLSDEVISPSPTPRLLASPIPTPAPQVLGTTTVPLACRCLWWPFVLGLVVTLFLAVVSVRKRLSYLLVGGLWLMLFLIANRGCLAGNLPSLSPCRWFIPLDVGLVALSFLFKPRKKKRKK